VRTALIDPIDRHLAERAVRPGLEEALYDQVALEMLRRKGVFLFVGDFQDAALGWLEAGRRPRCLRVLELFREWGRRRPLLVARGPRAAPDVVPTGGALKMFAVLDLPHFLAGCQARLYESRGSGAGARLLVGPPGGRNGARWLTREEFLGQYGDRLRERLGKI